MEPAEGTRSVSVERRSSCFGVSALWHELDRCAGRIPVRFNPRCPRERDIEKVEFASHVPKMAPASDRRQARNLRLRLSTPIDEG